MAAHSGGLEALPPPDPEERVPTPDEAERDAFRDLVTSGAGERVENLPPSSNVLSRKDKEQDIWLKRSYGIALLIVLILQVGAADYLFYRYADEGRNWGIEASVMQAWLAATVIEIVGIAAIVVRYLFPRRDDQP